MNSRKKVLPQLKITTAEEPSYMWSRNRTSSAGIHGRRFFCCCYFQLGKNLLLWLPTKEVLPRDGMEEGSSAVNVTTVEEPSSMRSRGRSSSARIHGRKFFRCCNLQLPKNLLPWLPAKELLLWDDTEEGSSTIVTLTAKH